MFGLGPTELIVILVLGLLVLGPERIPGVATSLGKAIRSFRRATRDLRDQIELEDDVRRPFEDLRSALRDEPPPPPPPGALPRIEPPAEPVVAASSERADATEQTPSPTHLSAHPTTPMIEAYAPQPGVASLVTQPAEPGRPEDSLPSTIQTDSPTPSHTASHTTSQATEHAPATQPPEVGK
jgi:TatA/E family protein of Tat protein translocase